MPELKKVNTTLFRSKLEGCAQVYRVGCLGCGTSIAVEDFAQAFYWDIYHREGRCGHLWELLKADQV